MTRLYKPIGAGLNDSDCILVLSFISGAARILSGHVRELLRLHILTKAYLFACGLIIP